jgi:hypothetical protein
LRLSVVSGWELLNRHHKSVLRWLTVDQRVEAVAAPKFAKVLEQERVLICKPVQQSEQCACILSHANWMRWNGKCLRLSTLQVIFGCSKKEKNIPSILMLTTPRNTNKKERFKNGTAGCKKKFRRKWGANSDWPNPLGGLGIYTISRKRYHLFEIYYKYGMTNPYGPLKRRKQNKRTAWSPQTRLFKIGKFVPLLTPLHLKNEK